MNSIVNDKMYFDSDICPITNEKRKKVKGKNKYKLFTDTLISKFLVLWPEYEINKYGKNRLAKTCFINELFYGKVLFNDIDRPYIEKNINKYNPCCYEYYLSVADNNEELAKKLFFDRQSNTGKNSFIKKYGKDVGEQKYKEYYDKLHDSNRGNNHWMAKTGISYSEYVKNKFGYDSSIFRNYKRLTEEEAFTKRSESSKKYHILLKDTDVYRKRIERYNRSMSDKISKLRKSSNFYETFGCWKACYNYCLINNIPYTDENRIETWRILFDTKYFKHWEHKGFSHIESLELAKKFFIFSGKSKIATKCLMELEVILNVEFEKEVSFGGFLCDAVLDSKKLVIEFFGDYWHKNPTLNRFSDKEILDRKLIDSKKIEFLSNNGYNVFIIWENEWKTEKLIIIEKLKKILL